MKTKIFFDNYTKQAEKQTIRMTSMISLCLIKNDQIMINIKDWRGRTLLSSACKHGNMSIVKMLVYYGAKINTRDTCGVTPLMLALKYVHYSVAEYLISYGATPENDSLDNYGAHLCALDNYGKSVREFMYDNNNYYNDYNYHAMYNLIHESGLKTSYVDVDIDSNYIQISLLVEQLFLLKNKN